MSPSLRSTGGCWTCRLRRKKCDESHPICSSCDSLMITCYGYGPKPDWIDGGEVEKGKLESFKQIVKHTSRQRGKHRRHSSSLLCPTGVDHGSRVYQLPKTSGSLSNYPDAALADRIREEGDATQRGSSTDSSEALQRSYASSQSAIVTAPETDGSNSREAGHLPIFTTDSGSEIQGNDAKLLMHFLDYIFPLQFPMYKPTTLQDRGWYLSLLVQIRPLYHAVLALSAFHQQALVVQSTDAQRQHRTLTDSDKHYALCLQRLQSNIQGLNRCAGDGHVCTKHGIGVQACIIQLIYLEMFVNQTDKWQLHLTAAIKQAKQIHELRIVGGLSDSDLRAQIDIPTAIQHGWGSPGEQEYLEHPLVEEQNAVNLLTGVTIYLDVISCVTLNIVPRMSEIHENLLDASSNEIQLQQIFGCDNWVILLIGKIAGLRMDDASPDSNATAITNDFRPKHCSIKAELESGIHENSHFVEQLECTDEYTFSPGTTVRIVTHIYALAALIYLGIMLPGAHDWCEEVRATVASITKALKLAKYTAAAQSLTWPIYIAGSVAIGSEREFFRDIFYQASSHSLAGNRRRTLEKLEEIWENIDTDPNLPTGVMRPSNLECSTLLLL